MMCVRREDYLFWGAKIDPNEVSKRYTELEREIDRKEERRFDILYDGLSGEYALAGEVVLMRDELKDDGFELIDLDTTVGYRREVAEAVKGKFPEAFEFRLYLVTHFR